jgi:hypothetical protein
MMVRLHEEEAAQAVEMKPADEEKQLLTVQVVAQPQREVPCRISLSISQQSPAGLTSIHILA